MKTNHQAKECNEGKHFFINSKFCDRCNVDFDEWYAKIIEEAHRETSIFMLTVLQSIINEQTQMGLLDKDEGDYIYQAVKDQCLRKGWID